MTFNVFRLCSKFSFRQRNNITKFSFVVINFKKKKEVCFVARSIAKMSTTKQEPEDIDIIGHLEKETNAVSPVAPVLKRVASLFKEDEPEWDCCGHSLVKKTAVETVGQFVLFLGMIGYIFYQLYKYFDPNENRQEIVNISTVDSMPMAFIYVDFVKGNDTNCTLNFKFYNGTSWTSSNFSQWYDWGNNPNNVTIDQMFDYVDNENDCQATYIQYESELSETPFFVNTSPLVCHGKDMCN